MNTCNQVGIKQLVVHQKSGVSILIRVMKNELLVESKFHNVLYKKGHGSDSYGLAL